MRGANSSIAWLEYLDFVSANAASLAARMCCFFQCRTTTTRDRMMSTGVKPRHLVEMPEMVFLHQSESNQSYRSSLKMNDAIYSAVVLRPNERTPTSSSRSQIRVCEGS